MSNDLLFFSLETSPPDVSAKNDIAIENDSNNKSQPHDFKKVLENQMVGPGKNSEDSKKTSEKQSKNPAKEHQDIEAENIAAVSGPLLEEIDQNLGKTLPSLTVHDRALEVGRLILTTTKPMVDENSLSEFVRQQVQSNGKALSQEHFTSKPVFKVNPEYSVDPQIQGQSDQSSNGARGANNGFISKVSKSSEFQLAQRTLSIELNQDVEKLNKPVVDNKGLRISSNKIAIAKDAHLVQQTDKGVGAVVEASNYGNSHEVSLDKNLMVEKDGLRSNKELELVNNEKMIKAPHRKVDSAEFLLGLDRQYNRIKNAEALSNQKQGIGSKIDGLVISKSSELDSKSKVADPLKHLQVREAFFKVGNESGIAEPKEFDITELTGTSALESKRFGGAAITEPAQDIDVRARAVARETATNLVEILTSRGDARDSFLRTEQYSHWSQRFGEILGQRLSVAINRGSWNVKLNLHPSSLGHIDITLDIGDKGIEGQISSADPVARQLLQDSLPKLRSSLAELYNQGETINLSLGDKEKSGSGSENPDNSLEVAIDLLSEEFAVEDGQALTVNGLDLFV